MKSSVKFWIEDAAAEFEDCNGKNGKYTAFLLRQIEDIYMTAVLQLWKYANQAMFHPCKKLYLHSSRDRLQNLDILHNTWLDTQLLGLHLKMAFYTAASFKAKNGYIQ